MKSRQKKINDIVEKNKKDTLKDWIDALIEAFVILLLLFVFAWPVKIEGSSMNNTFEDGNRVFISHITGWFDLYGKGDIVVFKQEEEGQDVVMIKRIIAEGGDTISIHDDVVAVNGKVIEEDYVLGQTVDNIDITVEEGSFFVMGDNRERSFDSRDYGTIEKNKIQGKVFFRWYPFNKLKLY